MADSEAISTTYTNITRSCFVNVRTPPGAGTNRACPNADLVICRYFSVEKFRTLEHLKARLTVVRWHLDAAALGNGEKKRRHLDSGSLTYQGALELLAQLVLPDAERAAITKELADLREHLRAAGQVV
jgi:hypothetical protein